MLPEVDNRGRKIKSGDIVMSYGEFLIYSHQTEKTDVQTPRRYLCAL